MKRALALGLCACVCAPLRAAELVAAQTAPRAIGTTVVAPEVPAPIGPIIPQLAAPSLTVGGAAASALSAAAPVSQSVASPAAYLAAAASTDEDAQAPAPASAASAPSLSLAAPARAQPRASIFERARAVGFSRSGAMFDGDAADQSRDDAVVPEAALPALARSSLWRARAGAAVAAIAVAAPLAAVDRGLIAHAGVGSAAWLAGSALAAGALAFRRLARALEGSEAVPAALSRALAGPGAALVGVGLAVGATALAAWSPAAAAFAVAAVGAAALADAGAFRALRRRGRAPAARELFTISGSDGARLLTIRRGQFGKLFLLSASLERGLGEKMLHAGLALETQRLVYFRRSGDAVELVARSAAARAAPGSALGRAIERLDADSVLARALIRDEDPATGAVTAPLAELLAGDAFGLKAQVSQAYSAEYELDEADAEVTRARAYPRNLELSVRQTFRRKPDQEEGAATRLPDASSVAASVRVSLDALPGPGYRPRRADARVGYFTVNYEDWSDDRSDRLERALIQRWRLEKSDPTAAASRVKNPIVFWLDPSVPPEYREAVARGVLGWNAAFAKAGLLDAIEVRQAPDDGSFDPDDARFNTIRWYVDKDAGYAIGQVRVDPLTGEIFGATVAISALHARAALGGTFQDLGEESSKPAHSCAGAACGRAAAGAERARLGADVVEARGGLGARQTEKFLQDYITDLVLHEVGHTLGLRHNFLAKTWKSEERLSEPGPVAASVMDYLPPNVAAPGRTQGPFWNPHLGPYDEWAIAYGYTPYSSAADEQAGLSRLAARSGEPGLDYATDEDVTGLDPDMRPWHLGKDPVAFARSRMATVRELWSWLERRRPGDGEDNSGIYRKFVRGWRGYLEAVRLACEVVGGVSYRRRVGPGEPPLSPIPRDTKLAALALLDREVFSDAPFAASAQLRRRLDSGRAGTPDDPWPELRYVSYDQMVAALREDALDALLAPEALERVEDFARFSARGDKPLDAAQLLDAVTASVWKETAGRSAKVRRSISPSRRALQEAYLRRLLALAYPDKDQGVPGISTLARARARSLESRLRAALRLSWDRSSREHLRDCILALDRAAEHFDP